jgi:hypothetical protein
VAGGADGVVPAGAGVAGVAGADAAAAEAAGADMPGDGAAGMGGLSESVLGGSGALAAGAGEELWDTGAAVGADRGGPAWVAAAVSDCADSRRTANTALQTLQRARTPASGTFIGSTRYTVAQFGQVTFIW